MKISTDTHPLISCGTIERDLLVYFKNNKSTFNKTQYSDDVKKARTTIGSAINRLIDKGLLIKHHIGSYSVTTKGEDLIKLRYSSVEAPRGGCRRRESLSLHDITFTIKLFKKQEFKESVLKKLNPLAVKSVNMRNWIQYRLQFGDDVIIFNTEKIIFQIKELIGDNIDIEQSKAVNRALDLAEKLRAFGLEFDTLTLEETHYARIRSFLSESLPFSNKGYRFDMGDGSYFWIDHSNGKLEDETNEPKIRERVDLFIKDMINSNSYISDIDKLKEIVGELVKIQGRQLLKEQKEIGIEGFEPKP